MQKAPGNMAKNCTEDRGYRGPPQGQPSHRVNTLRRDPGTQRETVNKQTAAPHYHGAVHNTLSGIRRTRVQTPASSSTCCATLNETRGPRIYQPPLSPARLHREPATVLSSGDVREQDMPRTALRGLTHGTRSRAARHRPGKRKPTGTAAAQVGSLVQTRQGERALPAGTARKAGRREDGRHACTQEASRQGGRRVQRPERERA